MTRSNHIFKEKLDLSYLSRYLNDNKLVVRPRTLIYISAFWSSLLAPDQANLLCALKKLSMSEVQVNDAFVITLDCLQDQLIDLGFLNKTESMSMDILSIRFAKNGFWKEGWEIVKLDSGFDQKLTMLEWISRTKIILSNSKNLRSGARS